MNPQQGLIRMDSSSYSCSYGNDVYSFKIGRPQSALIFFPGDIQDTEFQMIQSGVANPFTEFSYEHTLVILHDKYPKSDIYIVRPSMKNDEICLYGKYLNCDANGNVSSYDPNGNAMQSLFNFIQNELKTVEIADLPIILVGFSRGGLVLNQILTELGTNVHSDYVLQRIREIHWLDCGNGNDNVCFPELPAVALTTLQKYTNTLHFYFHMTSYLYKQDASAASNVQLQAMIDQLQSIGIFTWSHFYEEEFKIWFCISFKQTFCVTLRIS